MQGSIHYGMKRRIEWSALLLFVLGLCSMAAPHKMVHATVHHQQMPSSGSGGTRTSRTTRQNGRSARGGMTTEMDHHGADTDRALRGVRPREVIVVAISTLGGDGHATLFARAITRARIDRTCRRCCGCNLVRCTAFPRPGSSSAVTPSPPSRVSACCAVLSPCVSSGATVFPSVRGTVLRREDTGLETSGK